MKCAIYTRKSTDEGLDQVFNSLDAQREACLAYIASQKSEGWTAIKDLYDDGGFSGGNMDRPALQQLMEDIKAGKVNIVVVYKIDRLTRSLMDFSKLVEVFDAHGVTFVSVTQSFNTTTSMGRLTLNVLLSFAQFEREVAGERIRDKIAASKKKGMWMGGSVPLGYEVKDRALVVSEKEADTVRHIYSRYLELGSVRALQAELERSDVRAKTGNILSVNVLYWLLQNPVYLGQVRHKGKVYAGRHEAIVSHDIWEAAQKKLSDQTRGSPRGEKKGETGHLLQGLLFDEVGFVYSPVYTTKNKKQYPYYVSRAVIEKKGTASAVSRLPAQEVEDFVEKGIRESLCDIEKLTDLLGWEAELEYERVKVVADRCGELDKEELFKNILQRVIVTQGSVAICIKPKALYPFIPDNPIRISLPFQTKKSKRGAVVIKSNQEDVFDLPSHELRDLVRGTVWRDEHFSGMTIRDIAVREGYSEVFVGRLIHASFEVLSRHCALS